MEALRTLQNKAERFEQLFNNSGVGIFIVNKDRLIIEANETCCAMFGYAHSEFVHQSALNLHLSYKAYVNFAEIAFNKVRQNEAQNLEYPFKHKDGKTLWLRIAGDSIPCNEEVLWMVSDVSSRIEVQKRLLGVSFDRRELKENNQNLQQLSETLHQEVQRQLVKVGEKYKQLQYQSRLIQMGEMLSMIAHQWRQPLAAIAATTSLLSGKMMLEAFNKETFQVEIEHIEGYVLHLSKTIDDFRSFFKADKKQERVSLEVLVEQALNIVKPLLMAQNITVIIDFTSYQEIDTYSNELAQAILNIIKNAEDAFLDTLVKAPKIWIRTYTQGENVCLEIKDNAGGIDEDFLEKIFEPYFSTKLDKDGTGLGLCMSKTIVEEHCEGTLIAHNEAEGAVFTISLPK